MENLTLQVLFLGCVLGAVLGATMRASQFCIMGALADVYLYGDRARLRMWLGAMTVAILGANLLQFLGVLDLNKSLYTVPELRWLSHLVGGVTFGSGMVLASGCGARTLVRLGGGSFKALLVLIVVAVSGSMTLHGVMAPFRVVWLDSAVVVLAPGQALPNILAIYAGWALSTVFLGLLLIGSGVFVWYSWREFSTNRVRSWLSALLIGAVIVIGWYVTGHRGYIAESPATLEEVFVATATNKPESFSFISPLARGLEMLLFWTDQSRVMTFGIASVLGVMVGSMVMALGNRSFRWEGFNSLEDLINHLVGAFLMGFGGITALGCTIGQGLSGISTLAIGSLITVLAIVLGSWFALTYQTWRVDKVSQSSKI